jgi:hypothetical protein
MRTIRVTGKGQIKVKPNMTRINVPDTGKIVEIWLTNAEKTKIVSSFIGIAIVALPSGIITAGYMERMGRETKNDD